MTLGDVKMSMNITLSNKPGLLLAEATGRFSIKEAKRTFLEILDAVDRYQAGKVLFDGSGLFGEPSTMERFYYGEFAAFQVHKLGHLSGGTIPRFAYVLKPPVLDWQTFGETVAVNRGMIVRTFESREDALTWL
jgi:hypothetical protein